MSQFSKIGKVMRHIYNLPEDKLPRNAEFKFKERAKTLVEKWHDILNASKSNGEGTVRKPAANGKAHSEEAGAKEDKEKSPSQEPPTKALSDAMDIDTKELDAEKDEEKENKEEKEKSEEADANAEADAPAESAAEANEDKMDEDA